jgi:hypothetical protein
LKEELEDQEDKYKKQLLEVEDQLKFTKRELIKAQEFNEEGQEDQWLEDKKNHKNEIKELKKTHEKEILDHQDKMF